LKSRIDPDTEDKIRTILLVSRTRGADPVTALDLAGLLRHRGTLIRDWEMCMDALIQSVRDTSAHFIDPKDLPRTPMDMKNAFIEVLEGVKNKTMRQIRERGN
jgi:hypothetical protein